MERQRRFAATPNLRAALIRRERSASWLARKIDVSPQLMSFVLNRRRSLAEEKAMRVSAVLDEPVGFLFVSVSTSVSDAATERSKERVA